MGKPPKRLHSPGFDQTFGSPVFFPFSPEEKKRANEKRIPDSEASRGVSSTARPGALASFHEVHVRRERGEHASGRIAQGSDGSPSDFLFVGYELMQCVYVLAMSRFVCLAGLIILLKSLRRNYLQHVET